MEDIFCTIFAIVFGTFCVLASPFVACHIIDHWHDPEPLHSGFTPECPEWTAPAQAPADKVNVEY